MFQKRHPQAFFFLWSVWFLPVTTLLTQRYTSLHAVPVRADVYIKLRFGYWSSKKLKLNMSSMNCLSPDSKHVSVLLNTSRTCFLLTCSSTLKTKSNSTMEAEIEEWFDRSTTYYTSNHNHLYLRLWKERLMRICANLRA